MITSSIRKLGFAGIASLLLVSGLATSTMTAQAAGDQPGSMTLLNSPVLGSMSSLGGVSGYISSQSGGDANAWLSSQGIDPTAAGPITDTVVPDQAQSKLTVAGGTMSLAPDGTGVNVGYAVGDAIGSDTLTASLSNLTVAPGHSDDQYVMTSTEYLTWLNGTTWHGHYTMSSTVDYDFTVAWSLDGVTVTPTPDTDINEAFAAQFAGSINNVITSPGSIPLSSVVAADPQYTWNQSFDLPYSFAYGVGDALTPGSSVTVNPSDIVSGSWLNDFNVSNSPTTDVLTSVPLTTWLSTDLINSLSGLDQFAGLDTDMTTADMTTIILNDLMLNGKFDDWASDLVISEVNSILSGLTASTVAGTYTMQLLSDADQAKILANTPEVMSLFANDGFPGMIANGVSATVQVGSTLDPGAVTSLIPTGVTVAADPAEVDTDASTLTLSAPEFVIDTHAVCQGNPIESPESITATATVVDTTGAPVVGATVAFGVEDPLMLDNSTHVTDSDGVATAIITLPYQSATPAVTHVTAHVAFGSGADLAPAQLSISPVYYVSPAPPALNVVATADSPVLANGTDSYTASISFKDICGVAQPDVQVDFSTTGSAQLSQSSVTSDDQGYVSVTLIDDVAEAVTVTATSDQALIGDPVTVTFAVLPSPAPTIPPSTTPPSTTPPSTTPPSTTPPSTTPPSTTPPSTTPPSTTPPSTTPPSTTPPSTTPPSTTPPSVSPTESATPSQSPSMTPTLPCSPDIPGCVVPPPSPCTTPECLAQTPVGGTLTLDPAELPGGGGNTMAIATIVNAQGQPVADVPVNFQIGGNALLLNESTTGATLWTDASGQVAAVVTTTTLDCNNPGFDVYASIWNGNTIQLSGSPARATILLPPGACEPPAVPPQVRMANATLIAGNATPGASVQVMSSAGVLLGRSSVDMTGYWSISTPAGVPSQQITVNEINAAGTQTADTSAWLDTDRPAPARVDQADTQQVAGDIGAVEASSTVTVIFPDGSMTMAQAGADGSYIVATPDGMAEGVVTVIVTDIAGNASDPVTADLIAYVPPVPPVPPVSSVTATVRYDPVQAGTRQIVTGSGFRYLERVTAQLCSATCVNVGSGYAGYNGQVNITFTVPNTATAGNYIVTLTGPRSGTASAGFEVTPQAVAVPTTVTYSTYLQWWAKWWWLF